MMNDFTFAFDLATTTDSTVAVSTTKSCSNDDDSDDDQNTAQLFGQLNELFSCSSSSFVKESEDAHTDSEEEDVTTSSGSNKDRPPAPFINDEDYYNNDNVCRSDSTDDMIPSVIHVLHNSKAQSTEKLVPACKKARMNNPSINRLLLQMSKSSESARALHAFYHQSNINKEQKMMTAFVHHPLLSQKSSNSRLPLKHAIEAHLRRHSMINTTINRRLLSNHHTPLNNECNEPVMGICNNHGTLFVLKAKEDRNMKDQLTLPKKKSLLSSSMMEHQVLEGKRRARIRNVLGQPPPLLNTFASRCA